MITVAVSVLPDGAFTGARVADCSDQAREDVEARGVGDGVGDGVGFRAGVAVAAGVGVGVPAAAGVVRDAAPVAVGVGC